MVLTGLDFEAIAQMSMWLYALTLVFEFLALILLRRNEPDLERPYKIPGGMCGLYVLSLPPCICCLVLMVLSEALTWQICLGIIVFGVVMLVPYYRSSGKPPNLPGPVAFVLRIFGCFIFRPLSLFDAKVAQEDSVDDEGGLEDNGVEMPTTNVERVARSDEFDTYRTTDAALVELDLTNRTVSYP
mmetsp:Transcript_9175/g.26111  ORF Transcript_9175/g.26111 Transcript_9175/m.26111 type:complete len:186 (+) Transcript_9175:2-559(+)